MKLTIDIDTITPGSAYNSHNLAFDPEGFKIYSWSEVGNGTPMLVYHGVHISICELPVELSEKGAKEIAEALRARTAFLQQVADDHDVYWDGSNHRGRIPDDLAEAWEEFCEQMRVFAANSSTYCSAADWLAPAQTEVAEEVFSLLSVGSFHAWCTEQVSFAEGEGIELDWEDVKNEALYIAAKNTGEDQVLEAWLVDAL